MFSDKIQSLSSQVIEKSAEKNFRISTAESCTGGLIISALTEISGSSKVVNSGYITYSNEAKIKQVNVQKETLEKYGAVSEQTVTQMAKGAQINSGSHITVAVSGIAGPTGGSAEKPVGLVYFAFCIGEKNATFEKVFKGNRNEIRMQTVETALSFIEEELNKLA